MDGQAIQRVPISSIVRRGQPRKLFPVRKLAGMAQSIRKHGVLQALLAHREGSEIVLDDGECRLRAAELAGETTVPVVIDDEPIGAARVIQRALVTNCQRVDLSPIEKAAAIDALMREANWSATEVSQSLGLSAAQVSKLLALLQLPSEVQEHVASGALAPSTAYEIAKMPVEADRARLAAEAATGVLTRHGVIDRAKALVRGSKRPAGPRRQKNRVVFPLDGGGTVTVTGRELTVGALVDWIGALFASLTRAHASGLALPEFVRSFSTNE